VPDAADAAVDRRPDVGVVEVAWPAAARLVVQELALGILELGLVGIDQRWVPKFCFDRSRLRSYWTLALISSASSIAMFALVRSTSA